MKYPFIYLCLLAYLLLNNSIVHAQTKIKRVNIEFSYGPSFPVGKFASKDSKDTSAGLAKTGSAVNLSFSYQFTNRFAAVFFVLGGSVNYQDADALANRWKDQSSNIETKVTATGR